MFSYTNLTHGLFTSQNFRLLLFPSANIKGFYGMILSVSAKVDSYSDNVLLCLPAADLDECALDVDNCTRNANCTNTPGSFFCTCEVGYIGDGAVECIGRI